jgi:anaerobic magnesium-protoporphyrin IX monomethyl ester cyclase
MKRIWLDLGDLGAFAAPASPFDLWQDHGLGLLRTILFQRGVVTHLCSVRSLRGWDQLPSLVAGYDLLLMNVRSYTFPLAREAAQIFKRANPEGVVVTGGMHATVALPEMESVGAFDRIVKGAGEQIIVDVATDPLAFPRVITGASARSMDDWPRIDRALWPNPRLPGYPWPLEPECGWGPGPVATILTSRVCPWQCSFCNEASFIANMGRRSPEAVIDELNELDDRYGPLGSVVIHDSMFFQQPSWLERWLDTYPRRAHRRWPYWAAARADTVRRWPDLFEALVRETNWSMISIGFESGSDRMLRVLNKECTAADNYFTIDLVNRLGDEYARRGQEPPKLWANIMLAIPGETREEAFDTMRMVRAMRYRQISPAFYSPYPGSALGYQLIAEGRSLMTEDNYHRYPQDEKVRGIDYAFYRDLLAGRYDEEIGRRPFAPISDRAPADAARPAHHFYLFDLRDGRQKLAYGATPEDALETLRARLPGAPPDVIDRDRCRVIKQRDLQQYLDHLG